MRLIDADALRKYFEVPHELKCGIQAGMDEYALKCIDEQPTVAASPWHRVEDELPEDGEWAIFTNGKFVSVERFKLDAFNHFFPPSQWFDFEDAIAWMPLPELPKEES